MRRSTSVVPTARSIMACCAIVAAVPAGADPFASLFGEPRRPLRPLARRRVEHRPLAAASAPLPVPRPPDVDAAAATPTAETAPAATPEPDVPLPPEKPPSLTKPDAAQAPAQTGSGNATPAQQPAVAPSGATTAFDPRQPPADATCLARLKAREVDAEPIVLPPQPDPRCTVVDAVRLVGMAATDGTTVVFPDKPTIACTTADSFSLFVRDLLVPLAKGTFGSPVSEVWTGAGLECRSRDNVFGAKLSAHGQGLAVDIAQLKLADGRTIAVGAPKMPAEQAFETASRAGACGYFHTVLGPGSDAYHRTHWHFDLEVRGASGDAKYCK